MSGDKVGEEGHVTLPHKHPACFHIANSRFYDDLYDYNFNLTTIISMHYLT